MQCNIDQRGRKARLTAGIIASGAGLVLLLAGYFRDQLPVTLVGTVFIVSGLFMIFEGLKGWCALRALGIKTPM